MDIASCLAEGWKVNVTELYSALYTHRKPSSFYRANDLRRQRPASGLSPPPMGLYAIGAQVERSMTYLVPRTGYHESPPYSAKESPP